MRRHSHYEIILVMDQTQNNSLPSATETRSYCRDWRNHKIIATEVESTSDEESPVYFQTTFALLKCCGCDAVSVRRDNYCDDPASVYPDEGWGESLDDSNGRHDYNYWPGIEKRPLPEWIWELKETTLKEVLIEIYKAFNEGSPILAAAGSRIVSDLLADGLLGRDAGFFSQKLDALHSSRAPKVSTLRESF
jgi:hypothetical protein